MIENYYKQNVVADEERIALIREQTTSQQDNKADVLKSGFWQLARGDRINGTDCGPVCRRRQKTHPRGLVINMQYKSKVLDNNPHVIYGREKEAEFLQDGLKYIRKIFDYGEDVII